MPESQNTEWKSKWKDEYLEWICGYANAQGGKIYIGCDDEGNVVGLPNARKLLEAHSRTNPDAMVLLSASTCWTRTARNILRSTCRRIPSASPAKASTTTAAAVPGRF